MVAECRRRNNRRLQNCLLCYWYITRRGGRGRGKQSRREGPGKHAILVGRQGGYNCTAHYLANTEISRGGSCLKLNGREMLAEHILSAFPWCWNLLPSWCPRNQKFVTSQQCYKAHFFSWASGERKSQRSEEFHYVCSREAFILPACLLGNIYCWNGIGSPLC